MDIIQQFLTDTCTVEQQALINDSIHTIQNFGIVDIELNLNELGMLLENNDTFEVIQTCYGHIRQYQKLIFEELGIQINCDNIATSNALLSYLSVIEESDEHVLITELLDNAETPLDGFLDLIEKVCYADLIQFEDIVERIPTEFIERIYNIHFSPMRVMQSEGLITVPEIDSRKKELLFRIWGLKQINTVKHFVYNDELNLPISDIVIMSNFRDMLKSLKSGTTKNRVAWKLVEIALIGKTEWKDLKTKVNSLAKDLYGEDPMYLAELSYQINNICIQEKINGSF